LDYRDVTPSELERFISRDKGKAKRILSVLAKNQQFLNAIKSPVGQELLTEAIHRMESLLEKIVNEDSNEKDRAEYRCLRDITTQWAEKISNHQKAIEEIKHAN